MIEIKVKKGTRICSKELGGCGRTIWTGEIAYMQMRSKRVKRYKRRFLCKECFDRKSY